MAQASPIEFPPFHLDVANEQLWRGPEQIHLRPKTFAALRYLVEHSEQLVTKEALFQILWPGTYVSDSVLMVCIRELRKALGDGARAPRFIETVHGRGYRFIAEVVSSQHSVVSSPSSHPNPKPQLPTPNTQYPAPTLVGREAELRQLHQGLDKALDGKRQTVFVTGEPGIGKTTIIEAFLRQLVTEKKVWIGRGQCIEHYGMGEAYMPVLEALGRLCREPEGEQLIDVLSQYAPNWLVQLPALLNADDFERLQRKVQRVTHERMLREMAEAVEAFTAERPFLLCLEDLHWSDVSTLELLSVLARRQATARLLVLGTYRPVEMLGNGHPLRAVKQELQLHHQCEELRLGLLTEADVVKYLQGRFPPEAIGPLSFSALARTLHQRTEGNPLFMVNVVDYMSAQGVLGESGETRPAAQIEVPESIQQMIEKQLDRLNPEEQRVLEVASVAGTDFSAAAVAAGTKMTTGDVEAYCTRLVRREQFLRTNGVSEWPDGTVATRYQFLHALYQEVLYERVPAGQCSSVHKWIGEREERAYGEQARAIAAELAMHFERGRDYRKAVKYLQQAGENGLRRSANMEAITHLTKGLELLKLLPDTPEHARQELTLQVALGVPLRATRGFAAPEVKKVFSRARELCQQMGETSQLVPVLRGLWEFYENRAEYQMACELGEQLLILAERGQDPALLLVAHNVLGDTLFWLGEFTAARAHLEQGITLYDPRQHRSHIFLYGYDSGSACLAFVALALWHLGYPAQALERIQEALTVARELAHPPSLAGALGLAAWLHQFRREGQAAQEQAEEVTALSGEQEFLFYLAWGTVLRGWALAEQGQREEGIAQMRQGISAFQTTGMEAWRPCFLALLAEAYGRTGQGEKGLTALAEAVDIVNKTGEHFWEAELYRLKGELTLQQESQKTKGKAQKSKVPNPKSQLPTPSAEAEAYFHKAIEIARKQQAKSLELRATVSLARLWQRQGKHHAARTTLSEIYNWFTEGFDTKDLQEAKKLLEELMGSRLEVTD